MTSSSPWHDVALTKLSAVLGAEAARAHMSEGLRAMNIERIESVDELQVFARHLTEKPGFAGAVGGLLSVHAVMNGARG